MDTRPPGGVWASALSARASTARRSAFFSIRASGRASAENSRRTSRCSATCWRLPATLAAASARSAGRRGAVRGLRGCREEQFVDNPGQRRGVLPDPGQVLALPGAGHSVALGQLDPGVQDGQGRAQFVAGVLDEAPLPGQGITEGTNRAARAEPPDDAGQQDSRHPGDDHGFEDILGIQVGVGRPGRRRARHFRMGQLIHEVQRRGGEQPENHDRARGADPQRDLEGGLAQDGVVRISAGGPAVTHGLRRSGIRGRAPCGSRLWRSSGAGDEHRYRSRRAGPRRGSTPRGARPG